LFLDFNKISIHDEHEWFKNVFVTGPGFQMAQIFVESIFEKYVDFVKLVETDDNYKNILQVSIQKEFKTTPEYLELSYDQEAGYNMGVYLCLGESIHHAEMCRARTFAQFGSFENIQKEYLGKETLLVFLGSAAHKIKKKAEQMACAQIIEMLESTA
jgi:dsRNA-specific ribonuclease